jgi:hypothetical protein
MARNATKGGKTNRDQGKGVTGASESATNIFPDMRTLGRGIGSSYADAVNNLVDQAPSIAGSRNGFLGQPHRTLNPNEYAGRHSLLPQDFNPRPGKK